LLSIIHDDIKPDNIMYSSSTLHCSLIDFGAAYNVEKVGKGYFNTSGTPPYAPPEYLKRTKGEEGEGDVWALGVTMLFAIGEVELPAGDWILPHALEGGKPRVEMETWLKRVQELGQDLESRGGEWEVVRRMVRVDMGLRISSEELDREVNRGGKRHI
jgi:serine/threonine protein kinase